MGNSFPMIPCRAPTGDQHPHFTVINELRFRIMKRGRTHLQGNTCQIAVDRLAQVMAEPGPRQRGRRLGQKEDVGRTGIGAAVDVGESRAEDGGVAGHRDLAEHVIGCRTVGCQQA